MNNKNIFKYLTAGLLCCCLSAVFTACSSEEDPYFTAGPDDMPRILNTDIPEGKGGEPASIGNIERTQNFTYELIVTPIHHTTVKWYIDDDEVAEGLAIDVPVLAGEHIVKIVATTTNGLSTSRTCKLTVRPAEGDPEFASDAMSRWLTIGEKKTVDCLHITSIDKLFIGKVEATDVSYSNGQVSFTVPQMAEGDYTVTIVTGGMRYGCGVFTVSSDTYVDPGIKETVLWEGSTDINWGDSNVFLSAEAMANVPVGATISLYYEIFDAEYHSMRITNQDWSADIVPQIDGFDSQPNPYRFIYTADQKAVADAKGMLITGFGYCLKKVTVE